MEKTREREVGSLDPRKDLRCKLKLTESKGINFSEDKGDSRQHLFPGSTLTGSDSNLQTHGDSWRRQRALWREAALGMKDYTSWR